MTPLLKPSASTKTSTGSVALIPGTSSDPFRRLFDLWLQQMCLLLVDFKELEPLQVWNGEGVDTCNRGMTTCRCGAWRVWTYNRGVTTCCMCEV